MGFKDQFGLKLGEETVEKKRRREGEKKEKMKRKRKEGDQASQDQEVWNMDFCMELTLDMNSIMDHMDFVWNSRKDCEFQT